MLLAVVLLVVWDSWKRRRARAISSGSSGAQRAAAGSEPKPEAPPPGEVWVPVVVLGPDNSVTLGKATDQQGTQSPCAAEPAAKRRRLADAAAAEQRTRVVLLQATAHAAP